MMNNILIRIAGIILTVESLIVWAEAVIAYPDETVVAMADASSLVTISTPLIYWFAIKPYIKQRDAAENNMRRMIRQADQQLRENAELIRHEYEEKLRIEQATLESENKYRQLIESANVVCWEMNLSSWTCTYVSPYAERLFGYPIGDWIWPNFWVEHLYPDDMESTVSASINLTERNEDYELEYRFVTSSGEIIWVRDIVTVSKINGTPMLRGFMFDITGQKEIAQELEARASYDFLTQIPNRRFAVELLDIALKVGQRKNFHVAVLYIDTDNFKDVNDTYGHPAGDALLIEMARRITSCIRASDHAGRMGGDEFIVTLTAIADADAALACARNISRRLSEPFVFEGHVIPTACSIGISIFPENGRCSEVLIKNADEAMYAAKKIGSGKICLFQADAPMQAG